MITFLRGELVEKHPTRAVLDVGGVGYEVMIPLSSYDRLPLTGDTCQILSKPPSHKRVHLRNGLPQVQQ